MSAVSAFAGGDPASLKLKVYAVYASTSAQCTNPVQIFLNSTGSYVDILTGPTLGGGDLPDGTYNCVMIKMSDIIKHTPKTTATTCVAGTEYTSGVCRSPQTVDSLTAIGDIACRGDGSTAGSAEDTVFMYMTTDSGASTGGKAFNRPLTAGDGNGIKLAAPLIIPSTTRAKFVVNASGQVVAGGGDCGTTRLFSVLLISKSGVPAGCGTAIRQSHIPSQPTCSAGYAAGARTR